MRRTRRTALIFFGSLILMVTGLLMAAEGPGQPRLVGSGVVEGLRRSPDLYVAAVLEAITEARCTDPKAAATCTQEAKIVEVLASHGRAFKPGDVIVFGNRGVVGSQYVAFLVPTKGDANVYGATSLAIGASDEARNQLVADLRAAGLRPGA